MSATKEELKIAQRVQKSAFTLPNLIITTLFDISAIQMLQMK